MKIKQRIKPLSRSLKIHFTELQIVPRALLVVKVTSLWIRHLSMHCNAEQALQWGERPGYKHIYIDKTALVPAWHYYLLRSHVDGFTTDFEAKPIFFSCIHRVWDQKTGVSYMKCSSSFKPQKFEETCTKFLLYVSGSPQVAFYYYSLETLVPCCSCCL